MKRSILLAFALAGVALPARAQIKLTGARAMVRHQRRDVALVVEWRR